MTLLQRFMQEEDALGTVELILIIVVLVGLVAIFKKQLTGEEKKWILCGPWQFLF